MAADELVDLIDDDGNVVGVVTRTEMRARRLPHRCVYILVFDAAGRLFIHLRTPTKDVNPSLWDVAVGGVLSAGEYFLDGARREIREELGVDADLEDLFPFRYADPSSIVQARVYRAVHDGPFRLQPEEVVRGEFVDPTALDALFSERPFCPDGLEVWRSYRTRFPGSFPAEASS